jgi:tetratricopeptide (TPR) repeat protein
LRLDRYGMPVTGSPEALEHLEAAVSAMIYFRPEVGIETTDALGADPHCAMGRALAGYLGVLGTEADDAARARRSLETWLGEADQSRLHDRERSHLRAAGIWLDGDMLGAGELLQQISVAYPRDLLALVVGHQIDFFTGNATSLRDRVGGALASWSPDDEAYSFLLGMFAFGLEEAGHYDRSEDVGREAVERNAKDVWGIHAVVHTYEMQGRFGRGLDYFDERVEDWSKGNFFNVHNWWHYCIYALEAGRPDVALSIYDRVLNNEGSEQLAIEMLDASSLLWRLYLEGADESVRWGLLAEAWEPKMKTAHYAFNDMHAVMSYVGAGNIDKAEAMIGDRVAYLELARSQESNGMFTREVGLPACNAVVSFARGNYGEVLELLMPIRRRINLFGGSHAQRDAVQRTLLEAAIRSNKTDVARMLVSERISLKPTSPYNWLAEARVLEELGLSAQAVAAASKAKELREAAAPRFAAA